jgi:hypothetical protein
MRDLCRLLGMMAEGEDYPDADPVASAAGAGGDDKLDSLQMISSQSLIDGNSRRR